MEIRTNASGWCWFQDPRAIYDATSDKTFFGTNNDFGDIIVTEYDHATGLSLSVNLKPGLEDDDHASPAFYLKPDRKLVAFWSKHNGDTMSYRTSGSVADIEPPWGTSGLSIAGDTQYCYPNPAYLANESSGKLFMHWRGNGGTPKLSTSTNLTTWGTPKTFFDSPGANRPYVKVATDNDQTIHYFVSDGHPGEVTNGLYHFYYTTATGWHKSDGTLIRSSVSTTPIQASEATRIWNPADGNSWNWDIALDSEGSPVVVFVVFESTSDHRYMYGKFNGSTWDVEELCAGGTDICDDTSEPHYSGGICLNHDDPNIVYLSKQTPSTQIWEIEKWEWNGTSWDTTAITSSSTHKNIRPVVPRNSSQGGFEVMWMEGTYPYYTSFKTGIKAA